MERLQNDILQEFLDNFIEELKRENSECQSKKKLNIPFIISTLYQSFNEDIDKYESFINDLKEWSDYNFIIRKPTNNYRGIIDVEINLFKFVKDEEYYDNYDAPNYNYKLCFSYEERDWGWCECTPDMPDYREDKHCCGHGCDASFCTFELYKNVCIVCDSWGGDEHDYWNFEDEFYLNDKELADKKAEEDKARMIKELKNRIEADSKKLAELEGE